MKRKISIYQENTVKGMDIEIEKEQMAVST